ncbi:MAG: hypothetical protein HOV78_11315 [Hamadaea sp.]|nr:hypothetical protein [Hamadaea sp.]
MRPVEQFPTRRDRDNQPRSHCTLCGTEAARRPEARAKAREARYRRKYGIGVADFEALLADQAGRCAICSRTLTPENWHVDHDHEDGRVRGVLCDLCNKGLGQFKDNVGNLVSAIEYLRRHA